MAAALAWLFSPSRVPWRQRAIGATALALFAALVVLSDAFRRQDVLADIDQVWAAAQILAAGGDPYQLIGPDREWLHPFPFYYPLTAPLLLWPLRDLPYPAIRALFVAISTWLLAFVLLRDGWHRLPVFVSGAFAACIKLAQWTPLYAAVLYAPALGFALAAKPNLGLVVLAGSRSWRAFVLASLGAVALTVGSLLLWPHWFMAWKETVAGAEHILPLIELPGAPVLMLALLRWRRWEARLLLAAALVPHTPGLIVAFLLLLIPKDFRSIAVLSLCTFVPYFFTRPSAEFPDIGAWAAASATLTLWFVYVPALVILLRMPNVGAVPPWLEQLASRWPSWLRGSPAVSAQGSR